MKRVGLLSMILAICVAAAHITAPFARADENFDVALTSTYTVSENGNTFTQLKFDLTNKKATVFAKQYALEIGANKLRNVKVYSNNFEIPANVVTTNNKTSIGITFSDKIVGEGKTREFTIEYDNPDTAIISGNVLEVYIPKLTNTKDYASYQVNLKTPSRYGKPARVTPEKYAEQEAEPFNTFQFDDVGDKSISALFGQKQIFEYTLRYNLANTTGSTGIMQIALPPDTVRQKVNYISLDPPPKEMTRDSDGNWIATYEIAAQKTLDVFLTGKAKIFLEPQNSDAFLPPTDALINAQQFWETNDAQIQTLAKEHHNPQDIYNYVVDALSYNYAKASDASERLGALGALANPKNAACQEFTDLFVAIARAANIPSRRVTGFAYTANSRLRPLSLVEDVLHAWPEYYSEEQKTWIPTDPTWGNTTGGINYFDQFDFNHLVFAINGSSSTTPFAAGSYKRDNENTKDVEVKFGRDYDEPNLDLKIAITKMTFFNWPTQTTYRAKVTNNTGAAWYHLPIELQTNDPSITVAQQPTPIDDLLPFQTREITFTTRTNSWLQSHHFTLTAKIGSLSSTHELNSGISLQDPSSLVAPISLGGGVVIITLITGSVLVSRRKR
jgi:transglutaminase-like putative cysteine protease